MTDEETKALAFLQSYNADKPASWRFWGESRKVTGSIKEACRILESSPPDETLAALSVCYWDAEGELREALGPLLLELAANLPPHFWPRIDEAIRRNWGKQISSRKFVPGPATVLVAMSHPWGAHRERACELADLLPPKLAASLLLVRVNDWACQTMELAMNKMETALQRIGPQDSIALAPLVVRLRGCGRFSFFRWANPKAEAPEARIERWLDLLARNFDPAEWRKAWPLSSNKERRSLLELLQRSGIDPDREIRQILFGSNDRAALLWYVRDVLPRLSGSDRLEAADAIARSRAVPVRKIWLHHLMEEKPDVAVQELTALLTDRSGSLREFARYHLGRLAPMDFSAYYLAALANPKVEPWALRGLAEVSPQAAYQEADIRLQSSFPSIRQAAIECLNPAILGDYLDYLLIQFSEKEPGPAKAARKRLHEIRPLVGAHLLLHRDLMSGFPLEAERTLIRMAPYFTKWQGLEFLLWRDSESQAHEEVREALRFWMGRESRAFLKLNAGKSIPLLELLEQTKLPERTKEILRLAIRNGY